MSSAKLVFILVLWLSGFHLGCRGEGSDEVMPAPPLCLNCTICEYPCQPTPLPPPSPPLPYEVPRPPPALPGYPTYGGPPPPPPKNGSQGKCPPNPATQCCQYPSPTNYNGYVPYGNHAASSALPIFVLVIAVLFSTVVLF